MKSANIESIAALKQFEIRIDGHGIKLHRDEEPGMGLNLEDYHRMRNECLRENGFFGEREIMEMISYIDSELLRNKLL